MKAPIQTLIEEFKEEISFSRKMFLNINVYISSTFFENVQSAFRLQCENQNLLLPASSLTQLDDKVDD